MNVQGWLDRPRSAGQMMGIYMMCLAGIGAVALWAAALADSRQVSEEAARYRALPSADEAMLRAYADDKALTRAVERAYQEQRRRIQP